MLIIHSKKKLDNARGDKDRKSEIRVTVKAMISIASVMTMFGLAWFFGALSIDQASTVFQVLFVIFNSTQGFVLFIFFCIIGSEAREEWKNLLTCNKNKKKVTLGPTSTSATPRYKGRGRGRPMRSGSTADTELTSRTSNTIRRSVGLPPETSEVDSSTYDSKVPMEMSEMPSTFDSVDGGNLLSIHEETSLGTIFENGHAKEKESYKSLHVLPPQIRFRLRRPLYQIVKDEEDGLQDVSTTEDVDTTTHEEVTETEILSDHDTDTLSGFDTSLDLGHFEQDISQAYLITPSEEGTDM